MQASFKQSGRLGAVRDETLAERLAEGPVLPLFALRCATDVAAALRELHLGGRAHGAVTPKAILLRPSGTVLSPPSLRLDQAGAPADVAAFGAVLYEMLTGCKPPEDVGAPAGPAPRTGPAGVRAAATRLAIRCLAPSADTQPATQQVATEMRLLWVMARQCEPKLSPPPRRVPVPMVRTSSVPPLQRPPAPVVPIDSTPPADEPVASPPLPGHTCPNCTSAHVYGSRPRSGFESLLFRVGSPPCRCRQCDHRYFVFLGLSFAKKLPF